MHISDYFSGGGPPDPSSLGTIFLKKNGFSKFAQQNVAPPIPKHADSPVHLISFCTFYSKHNTTQSQQFTSFYKKLHC